MKTDKFVFGYGEKLFALDTSQVVSVTEVERIFFLPGRKGFVEGVISSRGEPVMVVDVTEVLHPGSPGAGSESRGPRKVIIVKEGNRLLGLDIGEGEISFLWEEELKDLNFTHHSDRFTSGIIDKGDKPLHILNWTAIYDEAARILSTEGPDV